MNLLLDEQLDTPDLIVVRAMNTFARRHGCTYRSLRTEAPGLEDERIPAYCQEEHIAALVSHNIRDFAAKRELFRALLEAGVSVVVLRPPRQQSLTPERQLALLITHSKGIARRLAEATQPILLRLTPTEWRQRTLEELAAER